MPDEGNEHHKRRHCPRCGKGELHRSHARSAMGRFFRRATPLRPYLCYDCDYVEWRFATRARHPEQPAPPGRPLEARDQRERHRRNMRIAISIAIAAALGIATGVYISRDTDAPSADASP